MSDQTIDFGQTKELRMDIIPLPGNRYQRVVTTVEKKENVSDDNINWPALVAAFLFGAVLATLGFLIWYVVTGR